MKIEKLNIGLFLLAILLFASCEKVIQVDISQKEEVLVVDAVISTLPNQSIIRLSKTKPLFEKAEYVQVSQAEVIIKSSTGEVFLMEETDDGMYQNPNLIGREGVEYRLEVNWEGYRIEAKSEMPYTVPIDSLEIVVSQRGFSGNDETSYSLKVHFSDPGNMDNYYRFDVFNNDSLYSGFIVSNDLYYDGLQTYQFLRNQDIHALDSITVQISSIDQVNYSYFSVLRQSGSPFNIAPGNPNTNIKGKAVGYFGAYAQNRKSILIPLIEKEF